MLVNPWSLIRCFFLITFLFMFSLSAIFYIFPCVFNILFIILNYMLLIMLPQLPQFFPIFSLHTAPLTPSGYPHTHCSYPWVMHISSLATPFSILYTLHSHGYSVTTYLYFFISSTFHPFPHNPFTSGEHQNAFHIYDSVSLLLVCLVCISRFNC